MERTAFFGTIKIRIFFSFIGKELGNQPEKDHGHCCPDYEQYSGIVDGQKEG
jgi:hypothetical protein